MKSWSSIIVCILLSSPCVAADQPAQEQVRSATTGHDVIETDISDHRKTPEAEGTRPFLFGCGVFWGDWYELPPDQVAQWNYNSMQKIKEMGATNIGAGGSGWAIVERERGVYDWTNSDRWLEMALSFGFEPFGYTGLTPQWALPPEAPRTGKDDYAHRFPPDEKYAEDFERWAETMARRYRGKCKYYEFWNEPNGCSWINDGCDNMDMAHTYVPWLKRWYTAMKRGNPDAVLAVGGLDYNTGVRDGFRYLEDIYRLGGGDYFDAVAVHPYGEPLNWQGLKDLYACMVRHGDGHKKIWLNEYGWNTQDEDRKAAYIQEVLDRLKTPEFHFVFMARYLVITDLDKHGHDYGLADKDFVNLQPVPRKSYEAFKAYDKTDFPPNADRPPPNEILPEPPPPPPGPNLLQNANFDLDFEPISDEHEEGTQYHLKAPGWELVGDNLWARSGGTGHLNHTPFGAQSVGTNWGVIDNAVYQRVQVIPGNTYRFSAWTRIESPTSERQFIRRQVGIDPTGEADVYGPNIVWSTPSYNEGVWEQQTVETVAQNEVITVFSYGRTMEAHGWQWFHTDTAELVDISDLVDTPEQAEDTPEETSSSED